MNKVWQIVIVIIVVGLFTWFLEYIQVPSPWIWLLPTVAAILGLLSVLGIA